MEEAEVVKIFTRPRRF